MSKLQDLSAAAGVWEGPFTKLDASAPLFGSPSLSLNGVNQYFSQGQDRVEHQLHSGDFVIDGWARFDGLGAGYSNGAILGKAASVNQSYYLSVTGAGLLTFSFSSEGTSSGLRSLFGAAPVGAFFYFEVGRSGSTFVLKVNGSVKATLQYSGAFFNSSAPLDIGRINVSGYEYYFNGRLREIRVRKGVAPQLSDTAPPTAPPAADSSDATYASSVVLIRGDAMLLHTQGKRVGALRGLSAFAPALPVRPRLHRPASFCRDINFGGRGVVSGVVKLRATPINQPVRRRVWLLRERDAQIVRETWSSAIDGSYSFPFIDETQRYTVIAFDHTHDKRAVIADNLIPDLMP